MTVEPILEDYSQLVGRKDAFAHGSEPNNPFCKIHTEGCSEAMKASDLCFWHYHRMGEVEEHECGCLEKKWKTATSDFIGSRMVQKYYSDTKICYMDTSHKLYCCIDSSKARGPRVFAPYKCGCMNICQACKDYHPPAKKLDGDYKTVLYNTENDYCI